MKKSTSITLAVLSMIMLSVIPAVSAASLWGNFVVDTLELQEKNPTTWNPVVDGAYGVIKFTAVTTPWNIYPVKVVQERMSVQVYDLKPKTMYQLIYYGNSNNNNVWPYATCIGVPRMTSTQGFFNSGSATFNNLDMFGDNKAQKFWVVLASDVDCEQGKMIAWNPTEYLFEANTI